MFPFIFQFDGRQRLVVFEDAWPAFNRNAGDRDDPEAGNHLTRFSEAREFFVAELSGFTELVEIFLEFIEHILPFGVVGDVTDVLDVSKWCDERELTLIAQE